MSTGLLDTSALIGGALSLPAPIERVAVSIVTLAELEFGLLRARDASTRSRRLRLLTSVRETYDALPADAAVASQYARIAAHLRTARRTVRVNDAWIAATALAHNASVVTRDADFDVVAAAVELDVVRL